MPTTIEIIHDKYERAKGLDRNLYRMALKDHLKLITDNNFVWQVKQITDTKLLGYLWSLGLSAARQGVVANRAKELE